MTPSIFIARILGPWLGITIFGKWVPAPYWSGAALMLLVAGFLSTRRFHRDPGMAESTQATG